MRKGTDDYIADKGKHFVLTEKAMESATFKQYGVGGVYDIYEHYVPHCFVDDGEFIEVDDPDWIVRKGFKVVYDTKGYQLFCGNPIIFLDREMAERYKKHYENFYKRYRLDGIPYIAEDTYEGKAPKPNKEYKGKRVFTMDNWFCDVGVEGDLVDNEIAMELANCVPPAYFSTGLIQSGEPADHRKEGTVYATFVRVDDDVWEYKGDCLRGKPEEHGTLIPVV